MANWYKFTNPVAADKPAQFLMHAQGNAWESWITGSGQVLPAVYQYTPGERSQGFFQ